MWLGLNDVEPLQSIQQFEEYQENPDLFQQKMADRKERDEVRKALNLKKSVEKANIKSGETKLKKNVLTRMQRKMDRYICYGNEAEFIFMCQQLLLVL